MGQVGRGTTIGYSTALTGTITYTAMATVISVDGPGITVGEVEDTLLSSNFKPYLSTLPEGESSLTISHVSADPAVIAFQGFCKQAPVASLSFQVTYPDGYTDTFQGFPKGYKKTGIENESRITASIDIRINTPITSAAPVG